MRSNNKRFYCGTTPDGCTMIIRYAKGRGVRAAYQRFLSSQAADPGSAKGAACGGYLKPYSLQSRPPNPRVRYRPY